MSGHSQFNINPTDLLFTNSFISNTNNEKKAKKYINKNLLDSNNINHIKNFKSPWPVKYNNIPKPILGDTTQDVSEEKYRKVKKTNVLLSSFYRNQLTNPTANDYILHLGREFNNVFKIEIVDFSVEKSLIPINKNNNMFGWEYPTYESLKTSNSEYVLYPTKYNNISAIPGVTSDLINCQIIYDHDSSQSVYTTQMNEEYSTINELRLNFEQSLSNIKIDVKNTFDPSFIKLKNPEYTFTDPTYPNEVKASNLLYKYPYRLSYNGLGPLIASNEALRALNVNFHLTLNENNQKCYIVNRRDLYTVIMIQTFRYTFTSKLLVDNDKIITDNIITNTNLFKRYIPCIYDNGTSEHGFKLLTTDEYENGNYASGGDKNDPYDERWSENGENVLITFKLPFYDIEELLNDEEKLKNAIINSWISYPIVFTDLPNMGAINSDLLNNTPFFNNILYHLDIYTNTNFPNNRIVNTNNIKDASGNNLAPLSWHRNVSLPPYVSTWYVYDLFQVKCSPTSPLYMRLSCKLSTGNVNDRPLDLNGSPLFSNIDLTYIFNDQFKNLVNVQDKKIVCCDISGCDISGCDISGCSIGQDIGGHFNFGVFYNDIGIKPLMGRAYPIKLLPNTIHFESKYTDYIGYKRGILDILGFINSENSSNTKVLSMKQPYRWVNTNFQDIIVSQLFDYQNSTNLNELFNIQIPQNKLSIQYSDNNYYLSSNNLLYIKLFINGSNQRLLSDNFLIASGINTASLDDDTSYNIDFYNKNSLSTSTSNKLNNLSSITASVNVEAIPSKKTYVKLNKIIEFNNKPIDNLNSFKIQLILPNGELFIQNENHYMNVIIYEKINVLKDTLLNTKDNTTTVTGIASIYNV